LAYNPNGFPAKDCDDFLPGKEEILTLDISQAAWHARFTPSPSWLMGHLLFVCQLLITSHEIQGHYSFRGCHLAMEWSLNITTIR
jgi:hypothetical protein